MTTKRGHHPDEIPFSEAELKRRKRWRAQDSRQKEYGRGQIVEESQQEIPLNMHNRSNDGLPLPPKDLERSQETHQPRPETDGQDPNRVSSSVRHRLYSHSSKTIAGQYRKEAQKLAEKNWLDANGHPTTTIIKDPSKRLRHLLEQKLHPEAYRKRPQLPKDYQEQAQRRYPSLSEPLSHLLYLHDHRHWNFDDIAFRFASSPQQIEHWYWSAHLLNTFHQRVRKLSNVS